MTHLHLYELSDTYKVLGEIEGESEEEIIALKSGLADIKDEIDQKVENIGKFILSLEAEVKGVKEEESRLSARRRSTENKIEWLKDYLITEMTSTGIDKVKRDTITVSVRTNPPSVGISELNDIPAGYRKIIPESWQPDKIAILENFKETGEIIPGTTIITDRKHLSIK